MSFFCIFYLQNKNIGKRKKIWEFRRITLLSGWEVSNFLWLQNQIIVKVHKNAMAEVSKRLNNYKKRMYWETCFEIFLDFDTKRFIIILTHLVYYDKWKRKTLSKWGECTIWLVQIHLLTGLRFNHYINPSSYIFFLARDVFFN